MRSFEEWKRQAYRNTKAKDAWKAGQESRQTEVDELQKRVDDALKLIHVAKGGNDQAVELKDIYKTLLKVEEVLRETSSEDEKIIKAFGGLDAARAKLMRAKKEGHRTVSVRFEGGFADVTTEKLEQALKGEG